MSSTRRKSTRARKARQKRPAEPPPPRRKVDVDQVERQLQDLRSVLACAALCLDEVLDPSQVDEQAECDASDVATLVRYGIQQLNRARELLDGATP